MKLKRKHLLYAALSLLWTGFIFSNSLKTAAESGQVSGNFLGFVNGILAGLSPSFVMTEHFIRKAAHFTEFAILGILLSLTVLSLTYKRKWPAALLTALAVASSDELLQFLSDGRSPQFFDVMIDFAGAVSGTLAVCLISRLARIWRKRRCQSKLYKNRREN